MLITRHGDRLAETFRLSTGFMPGSVDAAADPYTSSVQWSRRAAGLEIWLALAVTGRSGYAAQLERDVALGEPLADQLAADGWQRVNRTALPLVCVTDPATRRMSPQQSWAWHVGVCDQVVAGGRSWISPVRLAGTPAVRACVTSYRSGPAEITELVRALHDARRSAEDLALS